MRVLVLTNEQLKEELLTSNPSAGLELEFLQEPAHYSTDKTLDACIDLLFEPTPKRIEWLRSTGARVIAVNAVTIKLADLFPGVVRINAWPTFLQKLAIEAVCDDENIRINTEAIFKNIGKKIEWVPDEPGMVSCRVISSIINEAFYTLEENVSTEQEIDTAMKLGTNYPYGPMEWAKKIGLQKIYSLLAELTKDEPRYQPSSLLKQKALA